MNKRSAHRVSLLLAAAIAPLAFRASPALADLFIAEGFDYPSGVALSGDVNVASAHSWDLTSGNPTPSTVTNINVGSGTLSYPGGNAPPKLLGDNAGDTYNNNVRLYNPSTTTADRIALPQSYTTGTLYYSFNLKVSTLGSALSNASTGSFISGFNNLTGSGALLSTAGAALCVRHDSTGNTSDYQLGIAQNVAGTDPRNFNTTDFAPNDVLFVVASYAFNTAGDVSNLYVFDGTNGDSISLTEPTTPFSTAGGTAGGGSFPLSGGDSLASFFLRNVSSAFASAAIDDIRVGNTYSDVVSGTTITNRGSTVDWNSTTSGVWDASTTGNWYNTVSNVANDKFVQGDAVTFADSGATAGTGTLGSPLQTQITLNTSVNPKSITDSAATTNYNISGSGTITGGANLTLSGAGTLTLATSNSYAGGTRVTAGTLILASANALPTNTALNVSSGATVIVANHSAGATYVPIVNALSNIGTIDLTNNAMIIHGGATGTIAAVNAAAAIAFNNGAWNGTNASAGVITSTIAAGDTTHLTAIGVATGLTTFETLTVATTDVLVKYTYYGDTNLDGKVDGTDYSKIDSDFVTGGTTGWSSGDFNYDGVINGSDYTLIDNAFNTQTGTIAGELASPLATTTTELAGTVGSSAVPEPTTLSLLAIGATGLLGRRRRAH